MIPVANLYYLLLYAWDALPPGGVTTAGSVPRTDVLNLLADVLNKGIDRLLCRGADRGYLPLTEAIPGLRGKLDLAATLKSGHLRRLRTVCEFDELTPDVPHNQILKTTLRRLIRTARLDKKLAGPIRLTIDRFAGVSEAPLTAREFGTVQLHRNLRHYRLLIDVCRLIHECLIPEERAPGRFRFRDFTRDEHKMRALFERFVRNFYRHHLAGWSVKRSRIDWTPAAGTREDLALLPGMETDITLMRQNHLLIIDTKFSRQTLQLNRGKESIHSGHLYQLFAYLKNLGARHGDGLRIDGMLLYPEVNRSIDARYHIHGHHIAVCTINLNQDWNNIHEDLLRIVRSD